MKGQFPSEETIARRLETKRLGYPPICDYSRLNKKPKVKRENKIDFAPIFFLIVFVIGGIAAGYVIETISKVPEKIEITWEGFPILQVEEDELQVEKDELQAEKDELQAMKDEFLKNNLTKVEFEQKKRFERIEFELKLAQAEAEKQIIILNAERKVLEFQLQLERDAKLFEAETQRLVKEVLEKK